MTNEDKIKQLEEENELLRERLDSLEESIEEAADSIDVVEVDGENVEAEAAPEDDETGALSVSRRGTLAALAGAGMLGVGATGTASAQSGLYGSSGSGDGATIGLEIDNNRTADNFTFGVVGRAQSSRARGIAGFAENGTGQSVALFGRNSSSEGRAIRGFADSNSGNTRGILATCSSPDGIAMEAINNASSGSPVGLRVDTVASDGTAMVAENDIEVNGAANLNNGATIDGNVDVTGQVNASGDLQIEGTKHFVQAVKTPGSEKKIRYTSVEAGRARTEVTDVAEIEDGRAEVELPEHFEMVTSDEEPLSVQVTPYATDEVKPQVVEHSTDRLVVEDFSEASDNYTFAYTVKGIREGYEDKEVVLEDE